MHGFGLGLIHTQENLSAKVDHFRDQDAGWSAPKYCRGGRDVEAPAMTSDRSTSVKVQGFGCRVVSAKVL